MPIIRLQRRMMELGRIRLGDKGPKGEPRKLAAFRLTSASRALLEAAAEEYGGTVKPWAAAPDEGYFELYTEADTLDVILPPVFSDVDGTPTAPYSQWFELWSGGGCQRRCDGETETLSGKPCLCDEAERACKVTTRVSMMLPKIPGLGVWRLETHGWNAATVLPGTLEVLRMATDGGFIRAVLRLEQRTQKKPGEPTRRFVVPVIDLPDLKVAELMHGSGPVAINGPVPTPPKPELPAGAPDPGDQAFANQQNPGFGEQPALPDSGAPAAEGTITQTQRRELFAIAREIGVGEDGLRAFVKEARGTESTKDMTVAEYGKVKEQLELVRMGG